MFDISISFVPFIDTLSKRATTSPNKLITSILPLPSILLPKRTVILLPTPTTCKLMLLIATKPVALVTSTVVVAAVLQIPLLASKVTLYVPACANV